MRVAIIGAGFSGLALSFYLLQYPSCGVTLFDRKGIGSEASGIASGLLHPYVGEKGRRSWKGSQGISATQELLAVSEKRLGRSVAEKTGILRFVGETEEETFLHHAKEYQDVEPLEKGAFLLKTGMTVYTSLYLEGLWKEVASCGAKLEIQSIEDLSSLEEYDAVVVAAGEGVFSFLQGEVDLQKIKGQILTCKIPEGISLPRSIIGKGYIATMPEKGFCHVGATYERNFTSLAPCMKIAQELLYPKISLFYPGIAQFPVVDCRAGVRVARKGHYFPFVKKIGKKRWVVTGMGSRGLLYHAFVGKILAQAIYEDKEETIPEALRSPVIKNSL